MDKINRSAHKMSLKRHRGNHLLFSIYHFSYTISEKIKTNGIVAYCDKKVPLGYIEGTNLRAKNIIRKAYGYRDKKYMKLKIIQGCSSIGVFRPYPYPNAP